MATQVRALEESGAGWANLEHRKSMGLAEKEKKNSVITIKSKEGTTYLKIPMTLGSDRKDNHTVKVV